MSEGGGIGSSFGYSPAHPLPPRIPADKAADRSIVIPDKDGIHIIGGPIQADTQNRVVLGEAFGPTIRNIKEKWFGSNDTANDFTIAVQTSRGPIYLQPEQLDNLKQAAKIAQERGVQLKVTDDEGSQTGTIKPEDVLKLAK